MNCDELATELNGVNGILAAQKKAGFEEEDALDALYASWEARISNIGATLNTGNVETLTTAVANGPWTQLQAKGLCECTLGTMQDGRAKKKYRRKMQYMQFPENMFTAKELSSIRAHGVIKASIIETISARMWLIGVECPSEPLLNRLVRLLACVLGNYDPDNIKNDKESIALAIKARGSKRDGIKLPYLETYPSSASLLPEVIRSYAYNDADVVIDIDMPELDTIFDSSSRMRAGKTPGWLQHVPQKVRDAFLKQHNMLLDQPLPREPTIYMKDTYGGVSNAFTRDMPQPGAFTMPTIADGSTEQHIQHLHRGPRPSSSARLELGDTPAVANGDAPTDDASPVDVELPVDAAMLAIDKMEREMIAATNARPKSDKKAAKAKAKAKSKTIANASINKKPAAHASSANAAFFVGPHK